MGCALVLYLLHVVIRQPWRVFSVAFCIGRVLADCRPSVGRYAVNYRRSVHKVSATYGRGIGELKSLDTHLDQLSTDYRPEHQPIYRSRPHDALSPHTAFDGWGSLKF